MAPVILFYRKDWSFGIGLSFYNLENISKRYNLELYFIVALSEEGGMHSIRDIDVEKLVQMELEGKAHTQIDIRMPS